MIHFGDLTNLVFYGKLTLCCSFGIRESMSLFPSSKKQKLTEDVSSPAMLALASFHLVALRQVYWSATSNIHFGFLPLKYLSHPSPSGQINTIHRKLLYRA